MNKDIVKISKFLSLVLRHKPDAAGVILDKEGWINVDVLIKAINKNKDFSLTKELLDEVVDTNDKKRFAYNDDKSKIRASQGHSIDIDLKLQPKDPPEFLYHGTGKQFVDSIMKNGIKKMSRNHVHLSETCETAEKVGSRHGKPQILKVNALEMNKDGFKFYQSDNGVWLVEEIPVKYIGFVFKYDLNL